MLNALSVDVEDYFQTNDADVPPQDWRFFEWRFHVGLEMILDILTRHQVKATFFVLSSTAEQNNEIIKEIASMGHEIASHGHLHRMLYDITPEQFDRDLRHSLKLLKSIAGSSILGYRAPSWSLPPGSLWAEEILMAAGIEYDSSVIPWKGCLHVCGNPQSPRIPYATTKGLIEFPASVSSISGLAYPFSLATSFRIAPYSWTAFMIKRFIKESNAPAMICLHPWDFDIDQPRLALPLHKSLLKYCSMKTMRDKLHRLLDDFSFGRMIDVLNERGFFSRGSV